VANETTQISVQAARRLAVTKQHLAGKLPKKPASDDILSVVRDLAFVQWDPIEVVAPSHVLSFWNRLGNFRPSDLNRLLWEERKLLQHWANMAAVVVLTEDYPLYYSMMRRYPDSLSKSWGRQKMEAARFLAEHAPLAKSIQNQLKKGPLLLAQFQEYVRTKRSSDGWSSGSDVRNMLFHLEMSGKVMVVGHQGIQNVWGLPEQFLPSWAERKVLSVAEVERETAQRAIQALGTASPPEINIYYMRGRYQNLKGALDDLCNESKIHRISVDGFQGKDERYVHDSDLKRLEMMEGELWKPRVSLLPPFDNLINGRSRTNTVFGFDYSHEMFLPEKKRKFGYYVLPILWGERLIGRVDPLMDKQGEKLLINSVHAEPGAPEDGEVASKIGEKIGQLAEFLGAKEVVYTARVPAAWKGSLH